MRLCLLPKGVVLSVFELLPDSSMYRSLIGHIQQHDATRELSDTEITCIGVSSDRLVRLLVRVTLLLLTLISSGCRCCLRSRVVSLPSISTFPSPTA